jgi:hypothetical protein
VLSPKGSESDNKTGNDIIIDYDVTGIGVTNPDYAMGGYSETGGRVEGNRIWLKQGTVEKWLIGGYSYAPSDSGDVTANYNTTTTVSGGSVTGDVYGGYSRSNFGNTTANHNTVTVSGGTVGGGVYGGWSAANGGNGPTSTTNYNTVTISGGTVTGWVYGGYSIANSGTTNATVIAKNNTVTLSGGEVGACHGRVRLLQ